MKTILSIDTSCDETSAAVTQSTKILSNIVWSQASLHTKWGGVVPSLAKRKHEERIGWVIEKALKSAKCKLQNLDAVAVTVGPGLAIALEVGIKKVKEISKKYNLPFIPVNHIEGHLLSPLARSKNFQFTITNFQSKSKIPNHKSQITDTIFPALGIVTSGGHTEVVQVKNIGEYGIIAQTQDDALGEALDKGARLLGFGYPGGEILEKTAKDGDPDSFTLPIPMLGREKEMYFSYSGLKTAFVRLIKEEKEKKELTQKDIANLAASFQKTAFIHFIRVMNYILKTGDFPVNNILAGGGVMANVTLRKMLRKLVSEHNLSIAFPYSKKLYTDNAAMIGIVANYKFKRGEFIKPNEVDKVDRIPRAKIDKEFIWE